MDSSMIAVYWTIRLCYIADLIRLPTRLLATISLTL